MPVKMRLQRHGSKKRPFYFIVVADARAPRMENSSKRSYLQPLTVPASIQLDRQRALDWLHKVLSQLILFAGSFLSKAYCT